MDAAENNLDESGQDIPNWEEIEAQYRAGFMSIREIGRQHGISHVKIIVRAKKSQWARNMNQEIVDSAALRRSDAKFQRRLMSDAKMRLERMLHVSASIKAGIRVAHRDDWGNLRDLHNALFDELADLTFEAEPNSATLGGRIEVLRRLTDTYKTIVAGEREAFGIEGDPPTPPEGDDQMPMLELARRLAFILQKGIEQAQLEKPVEKGEPGNV